MMNISLELVAAVARDKILKLNEDGRYIQGKKDGMVELHAALEELVKQAEDKEAAEAKLIKMDVPNEQPT